MKLSPKKDLSYLVYYFIYLVTFISLHYLGYLMKICENVYYFSPVILGIKEGKRNTKRKDA